MGVSYSKSSFSRYTVANLSGYTVFNLNSYTELAGVFYGRIKFLKLSSTNDVHF